MSERIDDLLGDELGCKARMVRFYALRMIVELARGKQSPNPEQRILFNKASVKNLKKVFKNE